VKPDVTGIEEVQGDQNGPDIKMENQLFERDGCHSGGRRLFKGFVLKMIPTGLAHNVEIPSASINSSWE